jgi:hypothetical protein
MTCTWGPQGIEGLNPLHYVKCTKIVLIGWDLSIILKKSLVVFLMFLLYMNIYVRP